jgi:hypothetical protein
MSLINVGMAALGGGIAAALLGWCDSAEPFNVRKFGASVIRSVIGAAGIAAATDLAGAGGYTAYILAFLAGAGVDAGGNRIAGAVATLRGTHS